MSAAVRGEAEVTRILRAFKKNPYEVLDIPVSASESEIKKVYRKKSLLIHPDKFKHEQGPEAFDLLNKAQLQLSDPEKRSKIDSIMTYARTLVLKSALGAAYTPNIAPDDPRLATLSPSYEFQLRVKAKELIIEESMDEGKRKATVAANEAEERRMKEEAERLKKRKREEAAKWEETRDARVSNWRDYNHTNKVRKEKKAKKSLNVLG